jgi:hypothetical protein
MFDLAFLNHCGSDGRQIESAIEQTDAAVPWRR